MKRRDFMRRIGIGAIGCLAAPAVVAKAVSKPSRDEVSAFIIECGRVLEEQSVPAEGQWIRISDEFADELMKNGWINGQGFSIY